MPLNLNSVFPLPRQDGIWNGDRDRNRSRSPKKCNPQPPLSLLPPMLPSDEGKHTLVLDMDGTLLHECLPPRCISHDVDFVLRGKLRGTRTFVAKRPFLEDFLRALDGLYEIVIFTESRKKCADVILDRLHNSKCIRHRLYRDSCTEVDGRLAKDLSRLGRDLSKVILVDDCPFSYVLQPSNALPIPWFRVGRRDKMLEHIFLSLHRLSSEADVRVALMQDVWNKHKHDPEQTVLMDGGGLVITPHNALIAPNVMGPLLFPMNPCDDGKHTLVLDMDETLLWESPDRIPGCVPDFATEGQGRRGYVYIRPGVQKFLARMEELFEIVLFTASMEWRANEFVKHLDERGRIRFHLCRDACLVLDGNYVKDVSRLGRDLRKVIIIDDSPSHFQLQPFNGIPIRSFRGDPRDRELGRLIPFLIRLRHQEDVRPLIQKKYDDDELVVEEIRLH